MSRPTALSADHLGAPGVWEDLLDDSWDDEDERAEIAALVAAAERRRLATSAEDLEDHDGPAPGAASQPAAPPSVAEDLPPLVTPPGYFRDRAGRWRYADGGALVPGARDRTLARSWRFARDAGAVLVPAHLTGPGGPTELAWVPEVARDRGHTHLDAAVDRSDRRRHIGAWEVPVGEWEARARVPLGIEAPELALDALLDTAAVAELARISPATVRSYTRRGYLPEPVRHLGGSPVWSLPIVVRALARRPGQGRRRGAA